MRRVEEREGMEGQGGEEKCEEGDHLRERENLKKILKINKKS